MSVVTLLCLTLAAVVLAASVRTLKSTTLLTAGGWTVTGLVVWWAAISSTALDLISQTAADVLFYLVSVVLLCPGIAVLGARRPGHLAWNFFVLLPLVAVLLWPALASTRFLRAETPLELESPALIGFGLVLVMGCGNYFGTRFTLPALLHAGSLVMLAGSMSASAQEMLPARESPRLCAAMLFTLAVIVASLRAGESAEGLAPLDRLWHDFVDQFGLVWAKRVMDRLNEAARHENWSADFQWHGIEWKPDVAEEERQRTRDRIEHTLRWLLKRFVDPEWIDSRLAAGVRAKPDATPAAGSIGQTTTSK